MLFKTMLEATHVQRTQAHLHPFNISLREGSLSEDTFFHFLRQDAFYLRAFADAHIAVSRRLAISEHQEVFSRLAHEAYAFESMIHQSYLADRFFRPEEQHTARMLPAVTAYIQHLKAMTQHSEVGVAVASLAPCYTLYRELGETMRPQVNEGHRYFEWIDSYASQAFLDFTDKVVRVMEALARDKTPEVQKAMLDAFVASTKHELMFWDAFVAPETRMTLSG